jgi:transcriptional regulator with XRE-family HTH domain
MSLQEVGDLTGASTAMINRLERGLRQASPAMKQKIARRLGVRIADLFEVEELEDANGST